MAKGFNVASFTDAWIETQLLFVRAAQTTVASFTDAWIETTPTALMYANWQVASFTDAWIETVSMIARVAKALSHLLQMRGLKLKFKRFFGVKAGRIFYRCVD